MNDYCTDTGVVSLKKYGEYLCGDHVETATDADGSFVMVLADGLGSGVKASILSTLTSKIISTMVANSLPVEDCVATVASTLPICRTRQVAYSTFTVIKITDNEEAEIIQYDNPEVIMLRDGRSFEYPVVCETIDGKRILKTKLKLKENDTFVAVSDGVPHAGIGVTLNLGWRREDIIEYLESVYPSAGSAGTLAACLASRCSALYEGKPGDDATVFVIKIRRRRQVNLLVGPPQNPEDVDAMMSLFFSKCGKHIVCGGTTSSLAAAYLGETLDVGVPEYEDAEIPPTAAIRGVDLVTEGVITVSRVLEYAEDRLSENARYGEWSRKSDGASKIARMLFEEATDINFFVGRAMNPAHQNPKLPIGFNIKMKLIDELSSCLEKMGKNIKVSYF